MASALSILALSDETSVNYISMSIYTKKGDRGETCIFKGKSLRVSKSSRVIKAIGAIDELNSFSGIVIAFTGKRFNFVKKELVRVQGNLLTIGSIIAGSDLKFAKKETVYLEKLIDKIDKELPPLKKFILPGGGKVSSLLQYSRSLTRKAEREVVGLQESKSKNKKNKFERIIPYLNRVSDYLFVLARWVNYKDKVGEMKWKY